MRIWLLSAILLSFLALAFEPPLAFMNFVIAANGSIAAIWLFTEAKP